MGLPSMPDSCSSMPMVSSVGTAVDRLTTLSSQWAMAVKDRTTSRSEILGELDGESRVTSVSLKRVVLRELHASSSMHLLCPLCPLPWLPLLHHMKKNGQSSKLRREAAMVP